jgi:hypothetical protein
VKLGSWLRITALGLLLAVMALAVLTARAVIEGRQQLGESDRAFNAGDLRAATVHARRAAVLYAPGAPHVSEAYVRLNAIALGSEAANNPEMAILAYSAVRGAALETRHLWIPYKAELERANLGLARLEARAQSPLVPAGTPEQIQERALRALERDDAPRAPWVIALLLGFALSVSGLVVTVLRGFGVDGRLVPAHARLGVALTVIGAACWAIAAWKA